MKLWQKALLAFGAFFSLIAVILLCGIVYFRLSVLPYYGASEKAFIIPGLRDGFIPQGMHYDAREECFFITGYMSSKEASPVYIVEKESGELRKTVLLLEEDGTAFTGHAGGIALYGDYVYLAGGSDYCLYVYSYSEILSAEDGTGVICKGVFSTQASDEDYVRISCLTVSGDRLIVGEFYRDEDYMTQDSHKLTTKGGDYNQAVAVEFRLSAEAPFGIEPTPVGAYSLPDHVQGMCLADGNFYLSTSYGATFSHILAYSESKLNNEGEITLLGETVTLYSLDSSVLASDYKLAPMAEEIELVDGRLYVMCESASGKYLFGNLIGAKWCYATDLEKMNG